MQPKVQKFSANADNLEHKNEQNRSSPATIFEHKNEQNRGTSATILQTNTGKISTKKII